MKFIKENIQFIVDLLLLVGITILLVNFFSGKSNSNIKELKEVYNQLLQEKEKNLQTYRQWKDREIEIGLEKDSLFSVTFNNRQKIYEPIQKNLASIPARIQRISGNDDSIRAAFAK